MPWGVVLALVLVAGLGGAGALYFFLLPGGQPEAPPAVAGLDADRLQAAVVSIQATTADHRSYGSGFLYNDRGHVLTNAHVVANATELTVVDHTGQRYKARPIGYDRAGDVALLEVPELAGRPPIPLGDSRNLRRLDRVYAFGSPLGLANTVAEGRVSALGRDLTRYGLELTNALQLDLSLAEGFSGGPVVDEQGRVVGIAVAAADPSLAATISFAIPIWDVTARVNGWAMERRTVQLAVEPSPTVGGPLGGDFAGPAVPPVELPPPPEPEKGDPAVNRPDPVLVRVAIIAPQSGPQGAQGQELANGATLAFDLARPALLDLGIQLETFVLDDKGDRALGLAYGRQLAADPSIYAVVGPVNSGTATALGPVLEQQGMAWITPVNRNAALAQQGWQTFHRLVAADSLQPAAAARWAWEESRIRRVYLLHDGTDLGHQQAAAFGGEFRRLGGEVVATESIAGPASGDLGNRIRDVRPDAIYFSGDGAQAGQLIRYLRREAGYQGPILGGSDLDAKILVDLAGSAATDVYFTSSVAGSHPTRFDDLYRAQYQQEPSAWAAYGYDAAGILTAALEAHARSHPDEPLTRAQLAAQLRATEHSGWMGPVRFNERGENVLAPVYLFRYGGSYPAQQVGSWP